MAKVSLRHVDKIFGPRPKSVIPMIKKGMPKIEILEKTGHTVGVYDVSIDIEEGELFVIMGLSGSGKSTLVRCLNRLIEPSGGEIFVDDVNVTTASPKELIEIRRKTMSMVFQNFGLLPHKTILENVAFGLTIQGIDKEIAQAKAQETIEMVGLKGYETAYPTALSGGMQQRVGLARALANDPEIILMDEAFSALDPLIRKEMQDEILDMQAKIQKTIIFITHDLDEALKLGDRIAIMKDGAVVQVGTAEEILINPATEYVKEFVKEVNRAKVITADTVARQPFDLIRRKDGLRRAMRSMEEEDQEFIIMVDADRTYLGAIWLEDAISFIKEPGGSVDDILKKDRLHVTTTGTYIDELLPHTTNAAHPVVVVVDENHKFHGIITRASLIKNLY